jgi:hypothetical protein
VQPRRDPGGHYEFGKFFAPRTVLTLSDWSLRQARGAMGQSVATFIDTRQRAPV